MGKINKGAAALVLGAIGVVFGDIGTSPLYAIKAVFGSAGHHLPTNEANIRGIISLVIWSVTLVVSVKYIGFVMRANNEGEGGIISLIGLIKGKKLDKRRAGFLIFLGLIGVALFYGDSVITPAISVLSAVEGLSVVAPNYNSYILPVALIIIASLFWIQKYGTKVIGRLFGPVMLLWFLVIGAGGLWQISQYPSILSSLSPLPAISFFSSQPLVAFIAMSAVMLTITGVEALYADMGHFGRPPISRAWFLIVFPALALCYMGQGALIINSPDSISNPLMLMFPESLHIAVLIIATLAALIASQAVISGAFSLTRQAVHLGFLPKMIIRHTSNNKIGQVYLPFVNIALFIVVSLLILIFGSSQNLAGAYGIAVSVTLAIDTILFAVVIRTIWHKSLSYIVPVLIIFLSVDLLFVSSNLSKIFRGGWFPLVLAAFILVLINTWTKGQHIITVKRKALEGPLQAFVDKIQSLKRPLLRTPGHAVYIGNNSNLAPLALHSTVEKLHELHEKVVIVSVDISNYAHIPKDKRVVVDTLKYDDGISHVDLLYGFNDSINIPKTLKSAHNRSPDLHFNPDNAEYFISQINIVQNRHHNLARWRKTLYCLMARNALSASDYYKLPTERTIEMRSLIEL